MIIKHRIKTLFNYLRNRAYISSKSEQDIVKKFHELYYEMHFRTWANTFWLGVPLEKCPLDCWIYQEILFETKPDVIIECGTFKGGGALFLASLLDIMGKGKIITIDIQKRDFKQHPRITYLTGSSTSKEIISKVKNLIKKEDKVMVILDSDHTKAHVLSELEAYNDLVSKGNYLIVEDTNVNGHPIQKEYGEGPMEALKKFMKTNDNFVIDKSKEKFYLTFNPHGYLRKIKDIKK